MLRIIPALVISILCALICSPCHAQSVNAMSQNERLGRGVNILGYDPIWRSQQQARFQIGHFQKIKAAGFQTVRINLHPFRHMDGNSDYALKKSWWTVLDWAVENALKQDLMVILDMHEFNAIAEDPGARKGMFLAFWRQVAAHCQHLPDNVLFEILNEPNRKLTPTLWNQWLAEALAIIRANNPTRTVIVGPAFWNSVNYLDELVLPRDDRNLIVTVHSYTPMEFTHQGAPWSSHKDKSNIQWQGTEQELAPINRDFDKVQAWSEKTQRPILLGEFGAYEKADMPSRVRYTHAMARAAEARHWSWAYWQFDSDFIVYDIDRDQWVEPILKALIPSPSPASLDWPNWRGPAKNGISQETDWSSDWAAEGPKVLWQKQVGTGFSSMAVSQGRVYTMGNTGKKDDKKTPPHEDVVYCFDAQTGQTLWEHRYTSDLMPEGYEGGTSATPTVAGNRVYTLSKHGQVFCLDTISGAVIWFKDLVKEFGIDLPTWGLSSSPLLIGKTVVLNAGTHGMALSQADGSLIWSTGKGKAGYSTPVEYRVDGLACLALFGENTLAGINAHTGELLWEMPWKARYEENIADPIFYNGHLFVSSFLGDRCSLFKIERRKLIERWQHKDFLTWLNSAVLWQGYAYGVHAKDRTLKCLDLETGDINWIHPDVGLGSLMVADGKLIVLTEKGQLLIAPASPEDFKPMATASILQGKCWTVPVLSQGRIYARNAAGDVVCVDVSTQTSSQKIPEGGQELLSQDLASLQFGARQEAQATGTIVPVTGQPFQKAWRVEHRQRPQESWFVTLHVDIDGPIQRGDTLLLGLTMRCLSSEDESGDGVARIQVQDRTSHERIGAYVARTGKTWQSLYYPLRAERAAPQGQANISIHLGGYPQCVELADIRLINYGKSVMPHSLPMTKGSYQGQAPDAAWRNQALKRIDTLRKGPLRVQVVDDQGQPVADARVQVELKRHAFGFGSVVHPTNLMAKNDDGDRYRDIVARYMNKAPLETGFRWQNWFKGNEQRGLEMRSLLDESLDWLNTHHIEVRGHYLMWAPLSPETQPAALLADGPALQEALFAHMAEKSQFAGQRVQEWDAINHIIGWGQRYEDVMGSPEIYAKVIRLGRQLNPHAEMWINEGQILPDGSRRDPYLAMANYLQQHQAGPDGIGFMSHFTSGSLTGMEELKSVYDEFAQLGAPLQLTELDVDTGFDEQLQADYLRDVLILSFSHPAVEAVNLWGFWEGRHWRPNAALWRKNWDIKPAGQVWLDLVHSQWHTLENGTSDRAGHFQTQGFLGQYEITVTHKNKRTTSTFVLAKNSPNITITLNDLTPSP